MTTAADLPSCHRKVPQPPRFCHHLSPQLQCSQMWHSMALLAMRTRACAVLQPHASTISCQQVAERCPVHCVVFRIPSWRHEHRATGRASSAVCFVEGENRGGTRSRCRVDVREGLTQETPEPRTLRGINTLLLQGCVPESVCKSVTLRWWTVHMTWCDRSRSRRQRL